MKLISVKKFLRNTALVVFACFASSAIAQSTPTLWQDRNAASDSSNVALLLPARNSYQRAVSVNASQLQTLVADNIVSVELFPNEFVSFQLGSSSVYPNGDIAWRGVATDTTTLATLSLVHNANTALVTVNTGSSKFQLRALRESSTTNYMGYLYSQNNLAPAIAIDSGGVITRPDSWTDDNDGAPVAVLALSGNDVGIQQTPSLETAIVGQDVSFSVEVTNNTSQTLSGEQLSVLFLLEDSALKSSSAICTTGNIGSQFGLTCNLPNIGAGEKTVIEYSVTVTANSYPFLSSAVFVGDVFSNEHVRNDAFVFVVMDTLTDSDNDGLSDFNENIVGTDPNSATSVVPSSTPVETDLMFLYTQKFMDDIGGVAPETKINQLVEVTNTYYANSGVGIAFRPVLYRFVDYTLNNSLSTAFSAVQNATGVFSFVPDTRSAVGADIVILIDGVFSTDSACGLGSTPGIGFSGEFYHPNISSPDLYITMYTDGFRGSGGSGCDDLTLAHELGHNHGLNHSRRAGDVGTFPYSLGHGVDGSFATIMANPTSYPGSEEIPLFSDPTSTNCNGLPCGVSRDDTEQGADAVFTLINTRFQIAHRRKSSLLPITSQSGSSNLIMYGKAARSSDLTTAVSSFSPNDSIDVRATLNIPREHQGQVGEAYVVLSVEGGGFFYRDATGNYINWDGELGSLQPFFTARPLNAVEELVAFENFQPTAANVSTANVTAFFAYAIPGTDVFVYSSSGIPISIQP